MRLTIPQAFAKAYHLLERVTPLAVDCGSLCGSRCCAEWETGVGMYLLPGEECMFSGDEAWLTWAKHSTSAYEFCPTWTGDVSFVTCGGECPRGRRPFACRTFPLVPNIGAANELSMVFDPSGVLICPLVQLGDISVLSPRFVSACHKAWAVLMDTSQPILDDVRYESARRSGSEGAASNIRRLMGLEDDHR